MKGLREKIAQLIIPRLDGNRLADNDYFNRTASLADVGIGGFILFGGTVYETPHAIGRLQERTKLPLLITSDIERGVGQQLEGGTRFPNQWAVTEAVKPENPNDVLLLHDMLDVVRDECISAGIHAVFSPVADVNSNPDNPIICTRSFGEDPEKVSWFVKEYVKGLQKGVIACAKHFPGHGDTAVDSHTSLPIINADRKRLANVELPPFRAAIEAGVKMIMVGHLYVHTLEPEPVPATFSKRVVTGLLREDMGFNGLVVTDALDMGALKGICNEGEAGVRALMAGCDILLHPSEPLEMVETVIKAVEDGRLSLQRVKEAFDRVTNIKLTIVECGMRNEDLKSEIRNPKSEIAEKIARKAIKFKKGKELGSSESIVCMVIDDDGDGSVAAPFLKCMKERFSNFRTASSPLEILGSETVVVPIFSKVAAWKGSSGLSKDSIEKLNDAIMRGRQSALISFGSPYILNSFDADIMINAFDPANFTQIAVAERLAMG